MKAKTRWVRAAGALAFLAFAAPALPCEGMRGTASEATAPAQEKAAREKEKVAAKATVEKSGQKTSAKPSEKSAKN